jgi:serine protease DegQ
MLKQRLRMRNLIVLLVFASLPAWGQLPFFSDDDERPSLAPLLRDVVPAVVNIAVESRVEPQRNPLFDDPFFDRFFRFPEEQQPIPRRSAGSGVIIDADGGYILTNHHVIENAEEIEVTLSDRRRFDATLIGSDEGTDIALLQIEADGLTALEVGDAEALEVGDFVIAIGNPFGLGQTVTSGIVSALSRTGLNIEGPEGFEDFIQTDASINPGNSGGALIDLDGKLVGINTAIVSPAGGNVGIGFAIPTSMAAVVVAQLLEYGEVQRGRLGIYIQDLTPELAEALNLDVDRGAIVTQVDPGSPAERAGIRVEDVITELNGVPIEGSADLRNRVGLVRVGEEVELEVIRDGERERITATVGETTSAALPAGGQTIERLDGAEFANLGRDHPRFGQLEGVVVTRVAPNSAAARNGLREGDIITAVNRESISTVRELAQAIEDATGAIALNIVRDDTRLFIVIQ